MSQTLTIIAETFTLHRLAHAADVPPQAWRSAFFAITRTDEELSLVLPETVEIESEKSEAGWACFKVEGPLAFNLVGILASIAGALSEAGVPIFALSTFDTDYVLVKREQLQAASEALTAAGYQVRQGA